MTREIQQTSATAEPSTGLASEAPSPRRPIRTALSFAVAMLLLGFVFFVLSPSPIDPASYDPPAAPAMSGPFAPNDRLTSAELLGVGQVSGPEDVDVDAEGRVYGGTVDGRIVRLLPSGKAETFAETGGRPLGLDFDRQGNLVVADGVRGILSVDPQGAVSVLVDAAGDTPLGFTDDVDVARDGRIYFSDASNRWGVGEFMFDLLEARPNGRLFRYDPASGKLEVLLDGLYFANGVALSANEDFVLVNETYRYRISRYWLSGPQSGTSDIFFDNLPGFPDGVSSNGQGTFWVAMFTVRNPTADALHRLPWLKRQMAKLPEALWPAPRPYGFVLGLNEQGEVTHNLQDPSAQHLREITSVEEKQGCLYLGSLHNDRIGKLCLTAGAGQ